MTRQVETILDAMASPHLFQRWFKDEATWAAWRAFLSALFALPLTGESLATYKACTGQKSPPEGPFTEAWLCVGRRGGKSFVLALVAVYLSLFRDWRPFLAPGERGVVMVVARDRSQAKVILGYIKALIQEVPALAQYIERETAEAIDLVGQISVEVHTASYRAIRGRTVVCGLCDEIAFWPSDDAAEPDVEILNALRPSMATIPQAVLLCASSPYSRRGQLYRMWREHHGKEGSPVLVWKAPSRVMNPTLPQKLIDDALEADRPAASAEYLAEFRSDVETFISREAVEGCIVPDRRELPPVAGVAYQAFVDPSGGSSDSMTLAVGHRDGERLTLDAVRERKPPFSPETVVDEFAALLKSYRVSVLTGDRYGGEWPRERFRKLGVGYQPAKKAKSDLYRDLLPVLNSGQIELLDHPKLINQVCALERRTARGGRDSIDHAPGGHDDLANVLAGVADLCGKRRDQGPQPLIW